MMHSTPWGQQHSSIVGYNHDIGGARKADIGRVALETYAKKTMIGMTSTKIKQQWRYMHQIQKVYAICSCRCMPYRCMLMITWCWNLAVSRACTATAVPYTCSSRTTLQRPTNSGWRDASGPLILRSRNRPMRMSYKGSQNH
jgi:hypothetical protein